MPRRTHPPWVLEADASSPPGSLLCARGAGPLRSRTMKSPRPAGGSEGSEGPGEGRSRSGHQVPSSTGLVPSQAPYSSVVLRAPLLCPICHFILWARAGPYVDSSLGKEMPALGPGCAGPEHPNLGQVPLPVLSFPPVRHCNPGIPPVNPTALQEPCPLPLSLHHPRFPPRAPKTFTNTS